MKNNVIDISTRVRVAIYARYSSDLQRPASIEDQIRQCSEVAAWKGWEIARDYIRYDQAKSGRTLVGREGLEELVRLAEQKPRPFDGIIIDDTSRFGRNLSDTLPLSDILENAGVFLHFVNTGLDSRDPNFRILFIAYGQQDEQASRHLGQCVHRGQRGRVLKGFNGNGRVFGYRNVPIEDPTRKAAYGRPYIMGVRLEINPEEAAIVKQIFELYVQGLGCRAIAKKLNEERIPSPLKLEKGKGKRIWSTLAMAGILKNEKYHGVHVWNKTKSVRNARTHRKEHRPRPESEWERVEVSQWRIISDALWNAAVEVNAKRRQAWIQLGGLNRTKESREYVFSGSMTCGVCGGSFNVIAGKGRVARYGCAGHRYRGTCPNNLTIRRNVLEDRLLQVLAQNLGFQQLRDYLREQFSSRVPGAWKAKSRESSLNSSSKSALRVRKAALLQQAENIVEAIAATKGSVLLYERLNLLEGQIRAVDATLASECRRARSKPVKAEVEEFLEQKLARLQNLFACAPDAVKQLVLNHVGRLVMVPSSIGDDSAYSIAGDIGLFMDSGGHESCHSPRSEDVPCEPRSAVAAA